MLKRVEDTDLGTISMKVRLWGARAGSRSLYRNPSRTQRCARYMALLCATAATSIRIRTRTFISDEVHIIIV